jgi:putative flippase GtrA
MKTTQSHEGISAIYQNRVIQYILSITPQFLRYAVCGGIAMVTDMIAFSLSAYFLFPCLGAEDPFVRMLNLSTPDMDDHQRAFNFVLCKIISFIVANLVAYTLNVLFVFRSGSRRRISEAILFYMGSAISIGIGGTAGWILIHARSLPTSFSYVATAACAITFNFILRKYVVFRDKGSRSERLRS